MLIAHGSLAVHPDAFCKPPVKRTVEIKEEIYFCSIFFLKPRISFLQITDRQITSATSKVAAVAVTVTRYFLSYKEVACSGELDCSSPGRIKRPICR